MRLASHIPNILTLANLAMGCLAIVFISEGRLEEVIWLTLLSGVFDLFDGMLARILKVQGDLGKQLDSLADMVSFGLVPGYLMYHLMLSSNENSVLSLIGFVLTLGAAYRLAVFNIDESQSKDFKGLATPSMALLVVCLPNIELEGNLHIIEDIFRDSTHLIGLSIILVWLMNSKIRLFSAKISFSNIKDYKWRIMFAILSLVIIFILGFAAAPFVLLLYILFSIIETRTQNYEIHR